MTGVWEALNIFLFPTSVRPFIRLVIISWSTDIFHLGTSCFSVQTVLRRGPEISLHLLSWWACLSFFRALDAILSTYDDYDV